MANYEDDDLDEGENNEEQPIEEAAAPGTSAGAPGGNRNFLLALGILGGIFLLLIIALAVLFLNRPAQTPPAVSNIEITNVAIMTANAQTAVAATQTVAFLLTPTETPVPPTATSTQVVAQATATATATATSSSLGLSRVLTETVQASTQIASGTQLPAGTSTATLIVATLSSSQQTQTASAPTLTSGQKTQTAVAAASLSSSQKTQTAVAQLTATKLPTTGFAEDAGLPGLFAMAAGLIVVIILVRRLRFSTSG